MERKTPEDGDLVVMRVFEGERGTIHEAMIEGHRAFPTLRDCCIALKHVEVIPNEGNGLYAYHTLVLEYAHRSSL